MLNQVTKVSSETCQQFVEDGVKISSIVGLSMKRDTRKLDDARTVDGIRQSLYMS